VSARYCVTVTAPDGETREVDLEEGQVKFMAKDNDPFMYAAWLAYCDLYTRMVQG
jgi:hypothetical protein